MHATRFQRWGAIEHGKPDDPREFRMCTVCLETLPVEQFYVVRNVADLKVRYMARCKKCCSAAPRSSTAGAQRRWRLNNPDYNRERQREYRRRIRAECLAAYGNRCACCGETEPKFLSIDHVNNDGAAHRRAVMQQSSSTNLYHWLRKNGYPQDGRFQILCHNCNMAKSCYGECPHVSTVAECDEVGAVA